MRETIPVLKRVAVSLWQLDTGVFYRSTTLTFRIGKSTAVAKTSFVMSFVKDQTSYSSSRKCTRNARQNFKFLNNSRFDIHQTSCTMDGSQIEIKAPLTLVQLLMYSVRRVKIVCLGEGQEQTRPILSWQPSWSPG